MSRYKILWTFSISLGLIGILLGLLLRYYFIQPFNITFKYFLHAHSHLMLLGWLLGALLLIIYQNWFKELPKSHYRLMLAMQICVVGMLCTFPFQGYGLYSISFSTLHIFLSYVLLVKLWKHSRQFKFVGKLVRAGIVFHFLSTLGPYALGPLMANDLRDSAWYDQAIYFYLHFQYNGSLLLFMLAAMASRWLKDLRWSQAGFFWLMTSGVVLTWAHSLDFSFDLNLIHVAAAAGSICQLLAFLLFLRALKKQKLLLIQVLVLIALGLKLIFQLAGSFPIFADPVVENRFLLIAYLHFIFLGVFTPFIWQHLLPSARSLLVLYWLSFVATEVVLVIPALGYSGFSPAWMRLIFGCYALLVICWILIAIKRLRLKR